MAQGSNAQKVPFTRAVNQQAMGRIYDQLFLEGKKLPCSIVSIDGWIATIKFELDTDFTLPQITIPVLSSQYDYLPLQEGDLGYTMSIDTYLGGVSGLGGGTAQLGMVPNLTALIFVPVGNESFTPPDDPLVRVVQGPNGVTIQTMDAADDDPPSSIIAITKDAITITRGDATVVMDDAKVTFNCDVVINGKLTSTDTTSLGGGAQAVKLADGSNATKVKAT